MDPNIKKVRAAQGKEGLRPMPWWSPLACVVLVVFFGCFLVITLPLAVVFFLVNYTYRILFPKSKEVFKASRGLSDSPKGGGEGVEWTKREFDIVLYGATGFTGRIAAHYLATTYPRKLRRWAVAGRNQRALESLVKELDIPSVAVIVAEAQDSVALEALVKRTRCVISTAGPFCTFSSEILRQCAIWGTHWSDITGELDWAAIMRELHEDAAVSSGAIIVSCCGHDSLPWDSICFMLSRELIKKKDRLCSVEVFDDIVAAPSGGTIRTICSIMDDLLTPRMKLTPKTSDSSLCRFVEKSAMWPRWSNSINSWTAPFFMAPVNAKVVERSNVLLGYNKQQLVYSESQVFPDFSSAFIATVALAFGLLAMAIYPLRWMLLSLGMMPAPGQGPSDTQLDQGFLHITAIGQGESGARVSAQFYFPNDAGYRDTARMLVESGVLLSTKPPAIGRNGGFFTPSAAFGAEIVSRLCDTGSIFSLNSVK